MNHRLSPLRAALFLLLGLTLALPLHAQLVDQRGSDTTFDIACWNIEQFPKADQTVNVVSLMVRDMELDLIGCEEITDPTALQQVASNAGGYAAITGNDYYGLRAGVIYNTHKVDVGDSYEIYQGDSYAFPRAPFVVPVTMYEADDTLSFSFMVIHLKAGRNDSDSRARRAAGIDSLKSYIDRQIASGGETRWMVVGDWNDDLDEVGTGNVFMPMLQDTTYHFLTQPIVTGTNQGTWIPANYFYDHLLVTSDLYADYAHLGDREGETQVLYLDSEYGSYEDYVSDHRPVASYFPARVLDSVAEDGSALPSAATLSVWPVPANGAVTIGFGLPQGAKGTVKVFDVLGREVSAWPVKSVSGRVSWNAEGAPTGMYFVRLQQGSQSVVKRAVIVK